jgi:hypothetical protein
LAEPVKNEAATATESTTAVARTASANCLMLHLFPTWSHPLTGREQTMTFPAAGLRP